MSLRFLDILGEFAGLAVIAPLTGITLAAIAGAAGWMLGFVFSKLAFVLSKRSFNKLQSEKDAKELEIALREAAAISVKFAGAVPQNVLALTFDWHWVPDNFCSPKQGWQKQKSFCITWRAYLRSSPSDEDQTYLNESTSYLYDTLWNRIVTIEDEIIVGSHLPSEVKNGWLYLRHDNVA